jgi:RND family efflux transporter MFP subunit
MKRLGCLVVMVSWAAFAGAQQEELDCVIQPRESLTLSFPVEGVVAEVLVDRGDQIEKGQVLARLDDRVEAASLQVARARAAAVGQQQGSKARLEWAQVALERSQELKQRDVVSDGQLDEALREQRLAAAGQLDADEERRVAGLEAERAAAVLAMRTITSPFNGVVVERLLGPGEWADPPQVLEVAEIDPLRVDLFAPLSMLGRIREGDVALVKPEEPVGGDYRATVTVVDRVVNPASGTFGVRLELANPEGALPAGVKCRVRFGGRAAQTSDTAEPANASAAELSPPRP